MSAPMAAAWLAALPLAPGPGALERNESCSAAAVYGGEFDCLHVPVRENRADPDGRQLELHVVVLPALGDDVAPDPVFLIMGGPGQSAGDKAGYFANYMARVRQSRDLVLVDLRGTGESNALDFEIGPEDLVDQIERTLPEALVKRELARLSQRADLTQYTTANAMDDLNDVRIELGYGQINLYGASYGTRAVQVFLRRHGRHVRTAVMRAVAPLGFTLDHDLALTAQRSLDRVFADCAADRACVKAYGDLRARFQNWLEELEDRPVLVETRNPLDGSDVEVPVTAESIALTIRTILYTTPGILALPGMIDRGARGELDEWAAMIFQTRLQQLQWICEGTALSVLGAEDVPLLVPQTADSEAARTFLGTGFGNDFFAAAAMWPHAEIDPSFWEPLTSDVPVLLISGELDPVTPPAFADQVARHLPNSRHLVFATASHDDSALRPCVEDVFEEFFRTGTVEGLDTSCVESSGRLQFHVR